MDIGVFIPIGNNGWLISTTSPQYKPSFDLNRTVVQKAEAYGCDFVLSMIKLRGFGGTSEFWDHNLEVVHADGGACRRHVAHPPLRNGGDLDLAARHHGAHDEHHQLDRARPLRG